jgi:hypothetical protein
MVTSQRPLQKILQEGFDQDPRTGKWFARTGPDDSATYFQDTPRGTPVIAWIVSPHDHRCPTMEGFPEQMARAIFWGLSTVRYDTVEATRADGSSEEATVYYRRAVLRSDLESKRDLVPDIYFARLDDAEKLAAIKAELEKDAREAAERAAKWEAEKAARKVEQEARWQELQARKLVEDKTRAAALGMSLEEYLEGQLVLRQMRKATRPGHCLVCKRVLSLKTSVTRGVGPECFKGLSLAERISAAAQVAQKVGVGS